MSYRLILFDFDGTLADSFPWFVDSVNHMADRLRFRRIEAAEMDRLRGMGARQVIKHLGISWWKLPLLARHMRRSMSASADRIQLFHGVPEMLHTLYGQRIALGVWTSNTEQNVRTVLGPSAAYIRYWQCEASLFGKAARLRAVLRATMLPRQQVLCVGDELRDADAARAAGVDFAAVSWGYATRDALVAHGSTLVFDSMDQVVTELVKV